LPQDYTDWLNTLTGTHASRYRDGKWVGFEGLVYDTWDRAVHVKERAGPWVRVWGAVDEGYTNPAVLLSVGEDADGRLHVFREFYERQVLPSDHVEEAQRRRNEDRIWQFILDPSAVGLGSDMRAAGLNVTTEVDNSVFEGIRRVQDRLALQGDGLPRLTVDPSCEATIREFESYLWKPGKDEPVKQLDHAMDALRYLVAFDYVIPATIGATTSGKRREALSL
jgi:phage terminase large subunit